MSHTEERGSEDATPSSVLRNQRIYHSGRTGKSHVEIEFVELPCGHKIPLDYLISWYKYCLKQKKSEFTCPIFNEKSSKTCGAECSYQVLCHSVPLTAETKEDLEKTLGELTASKLCEYKQCPGCQSYVERADKKNLCVRCTICTAKKEGTYEFCWNCKRRWKGPAIGALKCGNSGCGEQNVCQPNPLQLCSPGFKRETEMKEKDDIYPIKDKHSTRKRLALLINNINFSYIDDRPGAEKDELSLEKLFEGLGYTVVTLRNLSAEGMNTAMRDFSQREEHKQSDSCFVVFMSHGNESGISGIFHLDDNDKDIFPSDNIFQHLNTPNCAGLRDKPKIILIQSCRGNQDGKVYVQDSVDPKTEHREKDFCCLRSCTPDTVAYRHRTRGSDFIQDIVTIFNQYAHQDHVEELFRKVLKTFKEKQPSQMPCKERTTLSKKFYLFPGL